MRICEIIQLDEMSQADQAGTSSRLMDIFQQIGLSVHPVLSQHFRDRLFGRERSIQPQELITAFVKAVDKYGAQIKQQVEDSGKFTGVIKDYASNINVVFTVEKPVKTTNPDKYQLNGITVMRKPPKQFLVRSGEVLVVENTHHDSKKHTKPKVIKKKKHFRWKTQLPHQELLRQLWAAPD